MVKVFFIDMMELIGFNSECNMPIGKIPLHKIAVNDRPTKGTGSWIVRRRFMFIISAFCMWTIYYVITRDIESRVGETAVMSAYFCLGSIVGAYVFGATWQDIRAIQAQNEIEQEGKP